MISPALPGAILLAMVCLLAGTRSALSADPFDLRATDWRVGDWQELEPGEQDWAVVGFSLGRRGLEKPGGPRRRPGDVPEVQARRGLVSALGTPEPRVAILLLTAERASPLPPFEVTGETWMGLEPRHRLALLHGFYAGTYAGAIERKLGGKSNPEQLEAAFAQARRLVSPELAVAPPLLFARLSDWLFYTNRRAAPLVQTIKVIAEQIKGQ